MRMLGLVQSGSKFLFRVFSLTLARNDNATSPGCRIKCQVLVSFDGAKNRCSL
jgi:hypothetical protein